MTWSCGTLAKAFCYANSLLPPEQKLKLKVMICTHPDHFIDSMANHTLPCVKLSDGQYYAIEPNSHFWSDPDTPAPFIVGKVQVGKPIMHKSIPYEVRKIYSYEEYESKCSEFGKFLKIGSKRDIKTKFILNTIEHLLTYHRQLHLYLSFQRWQ